MAWLVEEIGRRTILDDRTEIHLNDAIAHVTHDGKVVRDEQQRFDEALRPTLEALTREWVDDLADIVRGGQADGSMAAHLDAGEVGQRLTALVEGLSSRWLAGLVSTAEARALLEGAVARELLENAPVNAG